MEALVFAHAQCLATTMLLYWGVSEKPEGIPEVFKNGWLRKPFKPLDSVQMKRNPRVTPLLLIPIIIKFVGWYSSDDGRCRSPNGAVCEALAEWRSCMV